MSNRDLDKIEPAREPLDIAQDVPIYSFFGSTLPNDTGIYLIYNDLTHNFYVGSARGKIGYRGRFKGHRKDIRNQNHHNLHLQRAINYYGHENFSIRLIDFCEKEICIEREQYYLDYFEPYYNKNAIARGGGLPKSEKTKRYLHELYAKEFELYHETLGIIKAKGIKKFAEDNNLSKAMISRIILGKSVTHKGYYRDEKSYLEHINRLNGQYCLFGLSSDFRGVVWHKETQKWNGRCKINKRLLSAGYYENEFNVAEAVLLLRQVHGIKQ